MKRTSACVALSLWVVGACAEPAPAQTTSTPPSAAEPPAKPKATEPPQEEPEGALPASTAASPEPTPPVVQSVSLGQPNDGTLKDGAQLPLETPALRFNPHRHSVARYATQEVLSAITRAAEVVHSELPGGRLTVNDLSLKGGGPIEHHGSHRNGRDADILFYLLDDTEQPIESVGAPLDPDGMGHDYKDLSIKEDDVRVHLDAPRTWRFVQALMEDPAAQVQRIFVVEHIRSMLLEEAARQEAPADTVARFGAVACQPGFPHDDHLHVRWFCDPDDIAQGCEELFPVYPWHRKWLAERDVEPVMARRHRKPPPSKTYSHKEARKKAKKKAGGRLHPDVRAFLARRKAWLPAPHPGRRWCK